MKTRVVILAGGEGSRLGILTAKRTKPAVPFAGKYRIIDFTLSNCVNSGLYDVMIIAQYQPHSLIEHIGAGSPWDLNRDFSGGVRMYTPYKARGNSDWFAGTADAIQKNYKFIKHTKPDLILILSGDHIYAMDYEPLITFHLDHQADLTMATIRVPKDEASRFGIVKTGPDYRVLEFLEKPADPPSTLANMGVYLFNAPVLDKMMWEDHLREDSTHDFGKDVIPRMVQSDYRVFGYPYSGYWVDVGTTQSYWQAHMDLLKSPPPIDLNNRSWVIHTRTEERPPAYFSTNAVVRNSLISDGCLLKEGSQVINSVLSPGIVVNEGVRIENSIILTDTIIGASTQIMNTIIDKQVTIGKACQIGSAFPAGQKPVLTTIGKGATLPDDMVIEPGAAIDTEVTAADFSSLLVKTKDFIKTKRLPNEI
jgi:glucose-1-phosphate adenylyltransferase